MPHVSEAPPEARKECLCLFDTNGDPDDHDRYRVVCRNEGCPDEGDIRFCSMSDCVCWVNHSGTCSHCSGPAELVTIAAAVKLGNPE